MAVTIKCNPASLGWLGQAYEETNPISPLQLFKDNTSDFTEEDQEQLVLQDVLETDGTIRPAAKAVLDVLARPEGFVRVMVSGSTARSEKLIYVRNGLNTSLDAGAEDFTIRFPGDGREALAGYGELTGSSGLVNVPFSVTLAQREALLLMSALDVQRQDIFRALGQGKAGGNSALDQGRIEEHLRHHQPSMTWLVYILKTLQTLEDIEVLDTEPLWHALEEKGLIRREDGKIRLLQETYGLAGYFLLPSALYEIDRGQYNGEGLLVKSQCKVVQCSQHDLLYLDATGETVLLETMSGRGLLELLGNLLEGPLPEGAGKEPAQEVPEEELRH